MPFLKNQYKLYNKLLSKQYTNIPFPKIVSFSLSVLYIIAVYVYNRTNLAICPKIWCIMLNILKICCLNLFNVFTYNLITLDYISHNSMGVMKQ